MPAATAAPPPTAPASNPPAPKAGPAIAAVNMPTPPAHDSSPKDAPGEDSLSGFDKYAKPSEEGLVHKNNAPKSADKPKEEAPKADADKEPESGESPAPKADKDKAEPAKPDGEKKKVSPWKLVEEHKARAAKAETEVAELRKLVTNEAERKGEVERLTKAETRAKELEDHLRYLDYQQHPEFQEKYQKPYDDHFNRVMGRLAGVKITTNDGSTRAVDIKDILDLGQYPADVVIEKAEEKFGKLGMWVAERVEELKQLSESKFNALEKAKTEGVKKLRDDEEKAQREQKEVAEFISETWTKAHKELEEHSKYNDYFKAKEGDEEHNAQLEKGEAFLQKAWLESPMEPGLTKEEREARTKRQAKAQKFIKGFGAVHLTIQRQKAEIEALKTELSEFKGSEPKIEGQRLETPNGQPGAYSLDEFEHSLGKYARPGVV